MRILIGMILFAGVTGYADSVKIERITRSALLNIDRRPDVNLTYSRCIGVFKAMSGEIYEGAVKQKNGRCPKAEEIIFDVESDVQAKVAGEETTLSVKIIDRAHVNQVYIDADKRTWNFQNSPTEVRVKENTSNQPITEIEDMFCLGVARQQNPSLGKEAAKLFLACNDCSSITKCFETRLNFINLDETAQPHAATAAASGSNAGTETKNGNTSSVTDTKGANH